MKRIIIIQFALSLTLISFAQSDPVSDFFNKYAGTEGYTTVNVTGDLFKMLSGVESENGEIEELSAMLKEVKILTLEDKSKGPDLDFYKNVYLKLDRSLYKELLTVQESNQHVNMLAKEENGIITEFILVVGGDDNVLISIKGNIALNKMAGLADSFDFAGFDKLKMLEEGQ